MKTRLLGLTALALLVPSAAADAAVTGTYEVSGGDSVFVRSRPASWVTGTLYRVGPAVPGPEHIDVQEISPNGWAYGYVYGSFHGCGWVDASFLKKINNSVSQTCPTDAATRMPAPDQIFSAWSDDNQNGRPYHTVDCAPAGATLSAYGNYRGGTFTNKYGPLEANHAVAWLYTTHDGGAVLVKDGANDVGAPAWFFIPAQCVAAGNPTAGDPGGDPGSPGDPGCPPEDPACVPPEPPCPPDDPACTPGDPGLPPDDPGAPTDPGDPVQTPPGTPGRTRNKVCWKTSQSTYCRHLRRRCRHDHNHGSRCRRALHGRKRH
jgi:hypothetical protein